ncbi:GNAT family N-acetyltransferase [Streptomyces sp. NPDC006208]|uniref:GNAT family N-acetyltransferase n=1 Tax=Streptomyces sp. NPDC006208 TaxID=3156734 RepID=UPI0033A4C1B9
MAWHLTYDVEEFRREADAYLTADPAGSTALISVSETLRRHGPDLYGDSGGRPVRFGWWREHRDAPVEAAFLHTPPRAPLFGPASPDHARELARTLRADGAAHVTGVKGPDAPARAFAGEWAGPGGWTVTGRFRLFRLGELTPPDPAPPGQARPATEDDVPPAAAWMKSFAADIGEDPDADWTANIARRVADGCLRLWETGGTPVSMAARTPVLAGQSRLSPVYTPPALRGRGYAGAVTCAVSRSALDAGAEQVLLFTDLANPTSNALYQRLGYRALADHAQVDFS